MFLLEKEEMLHLILSKKHYLPAKNFEHSLKQCSQVRRYGGRACVEGCKILDRHKIKQCEMRPVCVRFLHPVWVFL